MSKIEKSVEIMGIGFNPFTFKDLSVAMKDLLLGKERARVIKANGEFLYRAMKNKEFFKAMQAADLCIADGVSVLWADKYFSLPLGKDKFQISNFKFQIKVVALWQLLYTGLALVFRPKYLKQNLPERLSGIEVFYTMMDACVDTGSGVFYFGARPEILEQSVEIIKKRMPKLNITGFKDGYGDKGEKIINEINKSGAKLLIVALGSPEQDFWIRDNLNKLEHVRVAVGEGGSFDAIAGAAKRAPKWIQKISLEWLWRMFSIKNLTNNAPHRFKRTWNAVFGFMFEALKWKINHSTSLETRGENG